MWYLIGLFLVIYTLACCFLIFVILIQSGKGGGLSSLAGASQGLTEALGATSAEKTLNKLTSGSAIIFVVFAILISLLGARVNKEKTGSILGDAPAATAPLSPVTGENAPSGAPAGVTVPAEAPVAPAPAAPAPAAPAPAAPAPAAPAPVQ